MSEPNTSDAAQEPSEQVQRTQSEVEHDEQELREEELESFPASDPPANY